MCRIRTKKLQHLAGRYLLKYLFSDFPVSLIQIADTRKPFLEDEAYHFSISHCGDYAAAIVSKEKRVGIDIEIITSKVERIKHKFLSEEEMVVANKTWLRTYDELLTLLWSCKEAVFKWYGLGEVDFKEHMIVIGMMQKENFLHETAMYFKKNIPSEIILYSSFLESLCLSYVAT